MGNAAPRLSSHTPKEPVPEWIISDEKIDALTLPLRSNPLTDPAKAGLRAICSAYLEYAHSEQGAELLSEALIRWNKAKRALEEFAAFSDGSMFATLDGDGITDASHLVEGSVFEALSTKPVQLTHRDIEPSSLDLNSSQGDMPVPGPTLMITPSFLLRLSFQIRAAVAETAKSIESSGAGFRPGGAFLNWLAEMSSWANTHQIPSSSGHDAQPSAFAIFLYELKQTFPDNLRPSTTGPGGMAKHLIRSRKSRTDNPRAR